MKILKVLLLSSFTTADDFQIRTKIEVGGETKVRLDDGIKNGIRAELKQLFCEDMKFEGTKEEGCKIDVLDNFKSVDETEGKFTGEVQFAVSLDMKPGESISKGDIKDHFEAEVPNVIRPPPTPEPTIEPEPTEKPEPTEEPTEQPPSGSGDCEGSGDQGSGCEPTVTEGLPILELEFPGMVLADLIRNIKESDDSSTEYEYSFIKKESLNIDSFVICAGECKDEGFWMMIAFICTGAVCLIFSGLSCLGSRRIRQISSGVCSLVLLGLMGGMIYVGVTEKVNWAITGGYIGGIVGLIILVNVIGCIKTKRTTKKVKNDEIEMYWDDLAKRDNAAKSD